MRFLCSQCQTIVEGKPGEELDCTLCGAKITFPADHLSPGCVIGDFAIVRELARGGVGVVFLARQLSLDRPVALKILQQKFTADAEFIQNFIREARVAARISHPNIVQAYAVGEEDGIFYFAMEFIDGSTMKQVLKNEGKVDPKRAAEIIRDITEALGCAWTEQKLVHQDIKPDNIMLTKRGQAKLADLGLARVAVGSDSGAGDDEVMGTPQYISPEQLTGVATDIRSDIYSLGASFYHLVTGRFPYQGKDGNEIAKQHVEGTLTDPIKVIADLPPELNRIIVKMMNKDINQRYQSAAELSADLGNFLGAGGAPAAKNAGPPRITVPGGAPPKLNIPNKNITLPTVPQAEKPKAAPPKITAPKVSAPPKVTAPKVAAPPPKVAAPAKTAEAKPAEKPSLAPPKESAPSGISRKEHEDGPKLGAFKSEDGLKLGQSVATSGKLGDIHANGPKLGSVTKAPGEMSLRPSEPAPALMKSSGESKIAVGSASSEPKAVTPPAPAAPAASEAGGSSEAPAEAPAKKGLSVKASKEDEVKAAPPIAEKLGQMLSEKPKKDYKWVKKVVIAVASVLVLIVIIATAGYAVVRSGKLPEKYKPYQDKVLAFLKLQANPDGTISLAGAAAKVEPAKTATPDKTPPPPPKPVEKPKPVTRPAYLAGIDEVQNFLSTHPAEEDEFLRKCDTFFTKFPVPVTPDERAKLNAITELYGRIDDRRRVEPMRKEARARFLAAVEDRKAAEAKRQAEEIERKKAQQQAVEQAKAGADEVISASTELDKANREKLQNRVNAFLADTKKERDDLVLAFWHNVSSPEIGDFASLQRQATGRKLRLPANAMPEEKAAANDQAKFADSLNVVFKDARRLYEILYTEQLRSITIELPGRKLVRADEFKNGKLMVRHGDGKVEELPANLIPRFINRLEAKFKLKDQGFYLAILEHDYLRLADPKFEMPSPFFKSQLPYLIESGLRNDWQHADEAKRALMREKFGSLPGFEQAIK